MLSVILAGQPPLLAAIKRDEAVVRRLTHCVSLRLLSRGETRQYMGAPNAPGLALTDLGDLSPCHPLAMAWRTFNRTLDDYMERQMIGAPT